MPDDGRGCGHLTKELYTESAAVPPYPVLSWILFHWHDAAVRDGIDESTDSGRIEGRAFHRYCIIAASILDRVFASVQSRRLGDRRREVFRSTPECDLESSPRTNRSPIGWLFRGAVVVRMAWSVASWHAVNPVTLHTCPHTPSVTVRTRLHFRGNSLNSSCSSPGKFLSILLAKSVYIRTLRTQSAAAVGQFIASKSRWLSA